MTRIASHRGGTLEYGDSTPAGFAATARMPLEEVEFDLHPTLDGQIVVHHDPTLDRNANCAETIAALTLAEVQGVTIHHEQGGYPITLDQLCAIFAASPVAFRCEIKPGADGHAYAGFIPKVIAELTRHGRLEGTIFSSFLLDTVTELKAYPRLWLVSPAVQQQVGIDGVIALAKARSIPEVSLNINEVDASVMAQVQAAGLEFGCWAAHSADQINKALDLGVKVFTTDRPSLAIALRATRT